MAARNFIPTLGGGLLATAAAISIAVGGAATAFADVTTQDGGSVDYDGTNGISRGETSQATTGHQITSDACFIKGNPYCPPPSATNPELISATTGTYNDLGSALDADGDQAAGIRGPNMVAVPQNTAPVTRGFYYPH